MAAAHPARGRIAALRAALAAPGLRREGALTFLLNGAGLAVNALTGILIARELGSGGRGEMTAIVTLAGVGVWLFSAGAQPAASFFVARRPEATSRLVGAWLLALVPLTLAALATLELLVPVLLDAQTAGTQDLARVFVLWIVNALLWELGSGILLGEQRFTFVNVLLFARLVAIGLLYVALALAGALTVVGALAAMAALDVTCAAVAMGSVLRRHGLARPDARLTRGTLSYGLRANTMRFGGEVNGRLDLLVMPALLPAASVGLYSVATNVSWILVAVAGALHLLVLPAAARAGQDGVRIVIRSAHATIAAGLALGLLIALPAGVVVPFVYGADFSGSVEPLILLLPGSVAMAAAGVVLAGLNAADRPLTAAGAQLPGVVITAVGLTLFLESGGIVAAALVSSAAYTSVFVTGTCLYRRATGIAWRRLLPGAGPA